MILKNISVLIDKFPQIFSDVRVFFVKFTDPSYIKIEKLKIISKLTNPNNLKLVVNELIEYSYELDLNFSRQALSTIWRLGILFPKSVETILSALISILQTVSDNQFANHILNELIIGMNLIFKKYQKKALMNSSVQILSQNFSRINEEDS